MSKLTGNQLRRKYLEFFKARGHAVIPSAPLVPENDPTTLFTSSGMQPLVPYLLGEKHPSGTRLVDSQPSVRMEDIDEVGDNRHTTFFEMLGNWSLGDYFKKEQLRWFWEFLTEEIELDPQRIYVTVFSGDVENNIPKDEISVDIWKKLFADKGIQAKYVELITEQQGGEQGMQGGRIFAYDAKKNWWSRAGVPTKMPAGEPGGPDSEAFYEFPQVEHDSKYGKHCHPNCDCGRFIELGNSVFMQYLKQPDGTFKNLPNQNVDYGGGFERILAAACDSPDVFTTDLFWPIIEIIMQVTDKTYLDNEFAMRIIADHLRAATFMMVQGLEPGNKQQGYVLRRLLRRAAVKIRTLSEGEVSLHLFKEVVGIIFFIFKDDYLSTEKDFKRVVDVGERELKKFQQTLSNGLSRISKQKVESIDGAFAFDLFQSYGFPFEITKELVEQRGGKLSKEEFDTEFIKHQAKSRTAAEGMFKGGLADHSENVVKYHTATHLLHAALRKVLGDSVQQKGSNITGERLRFDFNHSSKVEDKELREVEKLVNEVIEQDLSVSFETMTYDEAIKQGALAFFGEKYPEKVKVYTVGLKREVQGQSPEPADSSPEPASVFSKEICGGPHVEQTGLIGKVEIFKETSAGAGVRRIYARMI